MRHLSEFNRKLQLKQRVQMAFKLQIIIIIIIIIFCNQQQKDDGCDAKLSLNVNI